MTRTRLHADEDILRLLAGGVPARAPAQPGPLQPGLRPELVQNTEAVEAAASKGVGLPAAAADGSELPARWSAIKYPAEAQPPAVLPASACSAPNKAAAAGECGTQSCGELACRVSVPVRERGAGDTSAAGGRALAFPLVSRRRPLHDAAATQAALGSAQAGTAAGAPAESTRCLAAGLRFPGAAEAGAAVRRVIVPNTFDGVQQYERVFAAALIEELNLRLATLARRFHAARARLRPARGAGVAPAQGPPGLGVGSAAHGERARAPGARPAPHAGRTAGRSAAAQVPALQRACRTAHLAFFPDCSLSVWQPRTGSGRCRSREQAQGTTHAVYLTVGGGPHGGDRGGPKPDFRKDDLWVIGSGPELEGAAAGLLGNPLAAPWVVIARSCWHGPNREGRCAASHVI